MKAFEEDVRYRQPSVFSIPFLSVFFLYEVVEHTLVYI